MKRILAKLGIVQLMPILALCVLARPAAAQSADPRAELDRILGEVQAAPNTAVALAKVQSLSRVSEWVPRVDYANAVDAAAHAVRDPRVAFALHQKAAWAFSELREPKYGDDGMSGPLGASGCVVAWELVGPFDNPSNDAFATALGPELGEVGPYAGKLVNVDWRTLGPEQRFCEINLNRTVQPSTAAVMYLGATVSFEAAQRGLLSIGANGAYKVWLNGALVAQRDEDVGMSTDTDAWPISLTKGDNHMLVKLASTQDGGLGVIARLLDRNFAPLKFTATAQRGADPVATGAAAVSPDPRGVLASIVANAATLTGDAAVWNAWLWKAVAWQDVSTPWTDVAERLLQTPDAIAPREHAMLAELFEEYWRRAAVVEAAANRAPDDPWIALRRGATLEASLATPDSFRARELYERLTAEHPTFLLGVAALADWYRGASFAERALHLLEQVNDPRRLEIPSFASRYTALLRAAGATAQAREAEQASWSSRYVSSGLVWSEISKLAAHGQHGEALAMVDDYLAVLPNSHYAYQRRAELLRAGGDLDGAIQTYDEMLAFTPMDANLHEERAKLLLAADRTEEALEAYGEAVQLRPQDQTLREVVAFLQPDKDRSYEPWLVTNAREIAAGVEPPPYDYDTIVDNSVTFVSRNGLASTVFQRVDRVLTPRGVNSVQQHAGHYQMGDENAEVLVVRVHKPDGSVSEDYDQWDSGNTRKGSTTYNDGATLTMRANNVEVGDLVEYRYRVTQVANENFRGDYFGDVTYLQAGVPIALIRYAVVYPTSWELYFRAPQLPHERFDDVDPRGAAPEEGFRSASFELRNVPLVQSDHSQPGFSDVYDYVMVSNKRTYDEIGRWWWNLVKEQLIVDEPIRAKVNELTKGLTTVESKVVAIHNYVVKNTRYLHVGLGIHGWKPYRTSTCFRNRYGDCKDKAALLKVMLEEAGVPAQLVLVRTRRLGSVDAQPASMHIFNHAITYVPSMDLYLDGTAEFNGTHELTTMDQGAQALVIEDGGASKFVTLPVDKPEQNVMRMELEVDLTGSEPITRGKITATGANAVYYRQTLEDPERRDEVLERQLADEFPGAELIDAECTDLSELEKAATIDFTMKGGELLRGSGDRQFVLPVGRPKNLLDAYAKRAQRTQDLDIRVPFTNETQIRYRVPATRSFEQVPSNTSKKSKFGSLDITYVRDGDALLIDVRYSIDVQRVTVAEYGEFRQFLSEVTAALNDSITVAEAQ